MIIYRKKQFVEVDTRFNDKNLQVVESIDKEQVDMCTNEVSNKYVFLYFIPHEVTHVIR